MIDQRLLDLDAKLHAAGIPMHGCLRERIDYTESATPEQRQQGDAILAAFKWDAEPVPQSVTGTQAKLALLQSGLYEAIEAWILGAESQPNGIRYRIIWDAANWYGSSPELSEIAASLGMTEQQVDDLFRLAVTL